MWKMLGEGRRRHTDFRFDHYFNSRINPQKFFQQMCNYLLFSVSFQFNG